MFRYNVNEFSAVILNTIIGFVSSFFGTGGGFIRTPVLVALFRFPHQLAVTTSLFALSLYASVGAFVYISLGYVQWYPTFLFVGLGLIFGSQIGARFLYKVRISWLKAVLFLLLIVMGGKLILNGF